MSIENRASRILRDPSRFPEDRVTPTVDFLATVCAAAGIDFEKQNMSNVGRPIRIVEKGAKPVTEVLA